MNERGLRVAGAALVAIVALWAGVRIIAGPDPRPFAAADRVRLATGAGPSPVADAARGLSTGLDPTHSGPKIPEQLPSFTLGDRTGKPTPIDTWRDKSLIINFWATWCGPCRREIPMLRSLNSDWSGRGIQVVGVAVDRRSEVNSYANELKITYPLLIGEQDALEVAGELGVGSPVFPFTVFTDRRGELVTLFVGELHRDQADVILSVVQDLNQERLKLPQARRNIEDGLRGLAAHNPG